MSQTYLLPQRCASHHDAEFTMQRLLPDGRRLVLLPRFQGVVLAVSLLPPFHTLGVYDERYWEFDHTERGLLAFHGWNPYREPEPQGWSCHPATGRYRIAGNRLLEYVRSEGSLIDQIIHAVLVTQGRDRFIQDIKHLPNSRYLPQGIDHFIVRSVVHHTTDRNDRLYESVFTTGTRCVVYTMGEIFSFSLDSLTRRLSDE
jgi:hypothetical protein